MFHCCTLAHSVFLFRRGEEREIDRGEQVETAGSPESCVCCSLIYFTCRLRSATDGAAAQSASLGRLGQVGVQTFFRRGAVPKWESDMRN